MALTSSPVSSTADDRWLPARRHRTYQVLSTIDGRRQADGTTGLLHRLDRVLPIRPAARLRNRRINSAPGCSSSGDAGTKPAILHP